MKKLAILMSLVLTGCAVPVYTEYQPVDVMTEQKTSYYGSSSTAPGAVTIVREPATVYQSSPNVIRLAPTIYQAPIVTRPVVYPSYVVDPAIGGFVFGAATGLILGNNYRYPRYPYYRGHGHGRGYHH